MSTVTLYPHQQKVVDEALVHAEEYGAVCIWLPTGGGKTEIAVELASAEAQKGGHTLFVIDRKELAIQSVARFQRYRLLVGIVRGEDTYLRGYEQITVASIQTLRHRMNKPELQQLIERTSLVIVDEAHVLHQSHKALIEAVQPRMLVGLSATPLREGMAELYHGLVRGPSYSWMIEHGYLVKPRYFCPVPPMLARLKDVAISNGDFNTHDLSVLMRDRRLMGDLVTTYRTRGEDRKAIVFCVDVPHAHDVTDSFAAEGYPAAMITHHTPDSERALILSDYRNGFIRILVSVVALSVGFDEPSVGCVIMARPTLSTSLYVQQLGRGLRIHEGKVDCLIFDHALNVRRHGRIEDFSPPDLSDLTRDSDSKQRDTTMLEDRPCPECGFLKPPKIAECPECGHMIHKLTAAEHVDADLVEFPNQIRDRIDHMETAKRFYLELLWICRDRGWKEGVAYHKTMARFGIKPPWQWKSLKPIPPSQETIRWMQSQRIRWNKSKKKQGVGR